MSFKNILNNYHMMQELTGKALTFSLKKKHYWFKNSIQTTYPCIEIPHGSSFLCKTSVKQLRLFFLLLLIKNGTPVAVIQPCLQERWREEKFRKMPGRISLAATPCLIRVFRFLPYWAVWWWDRRQISFSILTQIVCLRFL